jgi:hypothetical protein
MNRKVKAFAVAGQPCLTDPKTHRNYRNNQLVLMDDVSVRSGFGQVQHPDPDPFAHPRSIPQPVGIGAVHFC